MSRSPRTSLRRLSALPLLTAALLLGAGSCLTDPVEPDEEIEVGVRGAQTLTVTPIAQQTEVWCWAATAEMVFRHYGLPNVNPAGNYQCGIVAMYAGPSSPCFANCGLCVAPIGAMSSLNNLLRGYGPAVMSLGRQSLVLSTRLDFRPLTFAEVAAEVNANRPVVAGISPGGIAFPNASQHVVVVVGYDATGSTPVLIVNDPYPFEAVVAPSQNPYLAAGGQRVRPGQYAISYAAFVGPIAWANTISQIKPTS